MLSKAYKKWPVPIFNELSEDQQIAFWKSDSRTRQNVTNDLELSLTSVRVQKEKEIKGGKYLPLGVYAAQGYETDKIAKNCKSKEDPDLELTTYLLDIFEVIEEKVRQDVIKLLDDFKDSTIRGKLSHYASPPAKRSHRLSKKRSRSDSSKRSGSSNSSNSSGSSKSSKSPATTQKEKAAKVEAKAKAAKVAAAAAKKKAIMQAAAEKAAAAKFKIMAAEDSKRQKKQKALEAKAAAAEARAKKKQECAHVRILSHNPAVTTAGTRKYV